MQPEVAIFVAGMPRAGSMWTFNVVRQLLPAESLTPWPQKVPPNEHPLIKQALTKAPGSNRIWCLKTHHMIPLGRKNVRIICNYRDVRDALLSFMRFMKCPFEQGIQTVEGMMRITDYYLASGNPNVMPARYNDIISQPKELIGRIATFLGIEIQATVIEQIAIVLSRERIGSRLQEMQQIQVTREGSIANNAQTLEYASIMNADGSHRIYDYSTGFQTNHINSSREGEWRSYFSAEQRHQVEQLADDWLKRYRFSGQE